MKDGLASAIQTFKVNGLSCYPGFPSDVVLIILSGVIQDVKKIRPELKEAGEVDIQIKNTQSKTYTQS
jgi:hypothetical protein